MYSKTQSWVLKLTFGLATIAAVLVLFFSR
jgi:hypothetical protein